MGLLYQPRSMNRNGDRISSRDHASPVGVWIDLLAAEQWDMQLLLWGRQAIACRPLVFEALERAGRAGIWGEDGAVGFSHDIVAEDSRTLARWCDRPPPDHALLTFDTPCNTKSLNLATLVGNTAHDLVQWALVDAGASADLSKRECDDLADSSRQQAKETVETMTVQLHEERYVDLGVRQSRSNGGNLHLKGWTGSVALSDDLSAAWPWLKAMELSGAGGQRAFGMGRVKLGDGGTRL